VITNVKLTDNCDLFVKDVGSADDYYQIFGPVKPSGNWFKKRKRSPYFVYRCVTYDSYTIITLNITD
jgi:hypothetical protein